VRPAELHSRSAEKNCLTENVSSLRSVKGATLPCDACASIPCGLAVRKQHEMLFAASKFDIKNLNLIKECDSMKKKLPIILLGVILACVLVFGFLYANNDIGKTANSLEADIRQSQKILDDWIVDGSISDTMAAFISYPQDKTDHTFSVYVNRPGLSFGYFFRGGGDIVEVDDYIAEFVVEGNNERAFISMNTQNIVRLEVDDGNGIQVIDIDSGKPFAIVLPLNVGNICFYDTNGNVVEYLRQQL
jgi:hypothetical protein